VGDQAELKDLVGDRAELIFPWLFSAELIIISLLVEYCFSYKSFLIKYMNKKVLFMFKIMSFLMQFYL